MARSQAYWSANLYAEAGSPPRRGAPLRDLLPALASRFRSLREGLVAISGASEHIRFMGPLWKWAWEYAASGRKLCWLHVLNTGVGGTFTLSRDEESRTLATPKLAGVILRAAQTGHMTGPIRWCGLEFTDRKTVDAFLGFMRRKGAWAEAAAEPMGRRRSAAG